MNKKLLQILWLVIVIIGINLKTTTQAGGLQIAGSPEYSQITRTGLQGLEVYVCPGSGVNNYGMAVGVTEKYVNGMDKGTRAARWDAFGTAGIELGSLGIPNNGSTWVYPYAINDAGTAVGWSEKFVNGSFLGERAVRWDASVLLLN